MKSLKGKRLLLIGGSLWKGVIKRFADENEIVLIVAGNKPDAGIWEIAEETYNVDSTNAKVMKELIRDKRIDGVYVGGSEPVISAACVYLQDLNLPCYCRKEPWELFSNKIMFKELCREHGLPVINRLVLREESFDKDAEQLSFPVITKPADGSGSSGFSVCNDIDELKEGYKKAKEVSFTGSVLTEKYVNNNSVVVFYTICNGEVYFSGIEDKYPVRYSEQGSYVAGAFVFTSKLINEFCEKFESKIKKMFIDAGVMNGSVWMEVFHDGEAYYFNEAGYRYGGSASIFPVNYFYGIDQVATDIYYALTGESELIKSDRLIPATKQKKKYYCVYSLHCKSGTINKILGEEELLENSCVVALPTAKMVGDRVEATGTISQVFGFVHFVFDTPKECLDTVETIHKTLKILDINGVNLLNRMVELNSQDMRFSSYN